MDIDLQFNNVLIHTLIVRHATSYECIPAIEWEGKYVMINTFKFCILIITRLVLSSDFSLCVLEFVI